MFHIDDSGVIDLYYLAHAMPLNPTDEAPEPRQWGIAVILVIGNETFPAAHVYPSRYMRDAAFEQICAAMRQLQAQEDIEEEVEEEDEG